MAKPKLSNSLMVDMFKAFHDDAKYYGDMYVTGPAGSGKTTDMRTSIEYCIANDISYQVVAHTHKACGILRSKLPAEANVCTLHSFLSKRPTVNAEAKNMKHVESNVRRASQDTLELDYLFVDEYSIVGERDAMDVRDAQDVSEFRVVWLGDDNQLPPVGDAQGVKPHGKYCLQLSIIRRVNETNTLRAPLSALISFIKGAEIHPLTATEHFRRGEDIAAVYCEDRKLPEFDGVMLAHTNKRVQDLNAKAQGYSQPKFGDKVFSPSTHRWYTYHGTVPLKHVELVHPAFGDDVLELGTKYRTLEHLKDMSKQDIDIEFVTLEDEEGDFTTRAVVFGHHSFKIDKENLKCLAALSNTELPASNLSPSLWTRQNSKHPLAKKRAKVWRDFLTFNESVMCIDFVHAMTVYKSQGSTFKSVYLDAEDLARVAQKNTKLWLKLWYVGISRASNYVVTN